MSARGTAVVLLASCVGLGLGLGGAVVGTGCGSKDEPAAPPPAVVVDAALPPVAPSAPGITELPAYDPTSGAHLDGQDGKEREPQPPPSRPRNRNARMIGIMLRSTPPGATAAVDGQPIGPTPTYWEGEFTGGEREFTFALAKHAVARYRFVPTTNGVVHGRLEPIADRPGAGTPAIPQPAYPSLAPRVPLGAVPTGQGGVPATAGGAPVTAPDGEDVPTTPAATPVTTPAATPAAVDGGAAVTTPSGAPATSVTPAPEAGPAPVAPTVEPTAPKP